MAMFCLHYLLELFLKIVLKKFCFCETAISSLPSRYWNSVNSCISCFRNFLFFFPFFLSPPATFKIKCCIMACRTLVLTCRPAGQVHSHHVEESSSSSEFLPLKKATATTTNKWINSAFLMWIEYCCCVISGCHQHN